jgi:cell wall-associated NlpC family hydrolase
LFFSRLRLHALPLLGIVCLALQTSAEVPGKVKADLPDAPSDNPKPAQVSSFSTDDIEHFDDYPPALQKLISYASELTRKSLTYTFASSDPANGGMDCSGTIYHLLKHDGLKEPPRQSDEMCRWVMKHAVLHRTENAASLKSPSFASLEPGDLLFWTGTYQAAPQRTLPITHVMLYLGKRKSDGKPIVFGASDGRSYDGQRRCGVSVFDFVLPKKDGKAAFYGYGEIPNLKKTEG